MSALYPEKTVTLSVRSGGAVHQRGVDARVRRMVERLRSGLWSSWLPLALSNGLTTVGLLAMILGTSPTIGESGHRFLFGTVIVVWGLIATKFLFRFWTALATPGRHAYLASADGLIDLAAAFALPVGWLLTSASSDAPLFALVWALRYIRHTSGLALFWRIMQRSRTPLLSIASLFVVIFLTAATLAYVFERSAQPEAFGSVPRTMWWAIVTLTTTGSRRGPPHSSRYRYCPVLTFSRLSPQVRLNKLCADKPETDIRFERSSSET